MHEDHFPLPATGRNLKILSYVLFSFFMLPKKNFHRVGSQNRVDRATRNAELTTLVHTNKYWNKLKKSENSHSQTLAIITAFFAKTTIYHTI